MLCVFFVLLCFVCLCAAVCSGVIYCVMLAEVCFVCVLGGCVFVRVCFVVSVGCFACDSFV